MCTLSNTFPCKYAYHYRVILQPKNTFCEPILASYKFTPPHVKRRYPFVSLLPHLCVVTTNIEVEVTAQGVRAKHVPMLKTRSRVYKFPCLQGLKIFRNLPNTPEATYFTHIPSIEVGVFITEKGGINPLGN